MNDTLENLEVKYESRIKEIITDMMRNAMAVCSSTVNPCSKENTSAVKSVVDLAESKILDQIQEMRHNGMSELVIHDILLKTGASKFWNF